MIRRVSSIRFSPAVPAAIVTWLMAASIATPAAQQAASLPPLTLERAMALATEANRTVLAARLQRPVAAAAVGVARERPNPELTFEATRETPKQSVMFSLPIEIGGKRDRRIGLADAGIAAINAEIDRVVAEVQNQVRRAYFGVVAANRRIQLATDARALAVKARDTAVARANAGEVAQQDAIQTNLGVFGADQDLSAARGDAAAARAELNVLLGQPADAPLTLTEDLTARPLPTLEGALAQVTQSNVALALFDRRIAEQTARRDLARALRKPDLTAGGGISYLAMPEFHVGYRASFGITLPLFTKHTAGVLLEDAELTRLGAEREAAVADITSAVSAALARAAAAREQMVRYETQILPLVVQLEQMTQEGYAAGQTPLVQVLTAQQQTRESRLNGLKAGLDYQMALADLERAMGTRLR
jgi:cobalt-zinc-cadmium efflux system outer membrane protein